MDFDKIKITEIVPAENNPPHGIYKDEFERLINDINDFGLVDPIIINLDNNKIISGHQRYEALLKQYKGNGFYAKLNILKLRYVGWCFTDADLKMENEDHEKALNLALNKTFGEVEFEKLNIILDELSANEFK